MTYIPMTRTSQDIIDRIAVTFDVRDTRGRAVGYRCIIVREEWVADDAATQRWNPDFAGRPIWRVRPHALRNGESYGASLNAKICLSEEDAGVVAGRMIAAYRKKTAKQFA